MGQKGVIQDGVKITPFCPTSGMSTQQVFKKSPMGPLQGSRVKIRGHMIAHRTPISPGTIFYLTQGVQYTATSRSIIN